MENFSILEMINIFFFDVNLFILTYSYQHIESHLKLHMVLTAYSIPVQFFLCFMLSFLSIIKVYDLFHKRRHFHTIIIKGLLDITQQKNSQKYLVQEPELCTYTKKLTFTSVSYLFMYCFLPAWWVCTHTDTEGKQRKEYFKIFGKNTIFNEHILYVMYVSFKPWSCR